MGRTVVEVVEGSAENVVVAGVDIAPCDEFNFPVYTNIFDCKESADVIIDFSRPVALPNNLKYAEEKNLRIVIATTGYSPEDRALIADYANRIPVFFTANMSLGVNLQIDLCSQAADFLGENVDIEIVEKHHNKKVDSPSGTALAIADAINKVYDNRLEYVFGRQGNCGKRKRGEMGIHAVRGGTVVGEHSVMFLCEDEIIEITHIGQGKQLFAYGALRAVEFVSRKGPGLYSMRDVVLETRTVTNIVRSAGESMITLRNLDHDVKLIADVLDTVAREGINIDIITQSSPKDDKVDLSFSLPASELEKASSVLKSMLPNKEVVAISGLSKLTVSGMGMETQHGVAARLFGVLARAGVKVFTITTSETKISFCVSTDDESAAYSAVAGEYKL